MNYVKANVQWKLQIRKLEKLGLLSIKICFYCIVLWAYKTKRIRVYNTLITKRSDIYGSSGFI